MVVTWVVWGWDVGGFTRWVVTSCGSLTHKLSHNKFPTDGALVGARSHNPNAHVAHVGLNDHIWSIKRICLIMWMGPHPPPTPPSQSLWILHPPRQHFCMLFSDEDWSVSEVQGVSTFYFPPSGKLKTLVLIPTSKTRTRRDLNLNNALRKRKRTIWTELNWTEQPFCRASSHTSFEAIPKRFRSSYSVPQ
jgi:hypothetical protein